MYSIFNINEEEMDVSDDYNNDYGEIVKKIEKELNEPNIIYSKSINTLLKNQDVKGFIDKIYNIENSFSSGYAKILVEKSFIYCLFNNIENIKTYCTDVRAVSMNTLDSYVFIKSALEERYDLLDDFYLHAQDYRLDIYSGSENNNLFLDLCKNQQLSHVLHYLVEKDNYVKFLPTKQLFNGLHALSKTQSEDNQNLFAKIVHLAGEKITINFVMNNTVQALENDNNFYINLWKDKNIDWQQIMNYFVSKGNIQIIKKICEDQSFQEQIKFKPNQDVLHEILITAINKANFPIIFYILGDFKDSINVRKNDDQIMKNILLQQNMLIARLFQDPEFMDFIINKIKMPTPNINENNKYIDKWMAYLNNRDFEDKLTDNNKQDNPRLKI